MISALARISAVAFLLTAGQFARAAEGIVVPTPRIVIYPGDIITEHVLGQAKVAVADAPEGAVARYAGEILGKAAARTLLPGRVIPVAAVTNPRLVRNGARVTLVFIEGGMAISTVGDALQDGTIGQVVKVRNSDTGVIVSGVVQQDGTVRVSA